MSEKRGSEVFLDTSNDSGMFVEYRAGPGTLLSTLLGLIHVLLKGSHEVDITGMPMLQLRKLRHREV